MSGTYLYSRLPPRYNRLPPTVMVISVLEFSNHGCTDQNQCTLDSLINVPLGFLFKIVKHNPLKKRTPSR